MKRLVAAFLCVSLVLTQYKQAEAAVPIAVAAVAAGSVLLLAAAGVQYYRNPSSFNAIASASGNIYAKADAYMQAAGALAAGQLYKDAASLKVAAGDFMSALSNSASGAYSKLKSALIKSHPEPLSGDGTVVVHSGNSSISYNLYRKHSMGEGYDMPYPSYHFGNYNVGASGYISFKYGSSTNPAKPHLIVTYVADIKSLNNTEPYPAVPTANGPVPADQVAPSLGANSDGLLNPVYNDEIVDIIMNNPSIVQPVASVTTAPNDQTAPPPPYVPVLPDGTAPADVPISPPTSSTGFGGLTTTAAQQNVTTAQQQVTTVEQQLAADPTNAALQQQLLAAQQALAAAQAALDQAKAAENEVYIDPLFPNRKTLNLESWRQLLNVLPSKFPFNLLTTLGSYFEPFLAAPVAPAFELHIYQDKKLNIDLSVFDTPVAIFRWGLALLLTFGMVQFLIRWWKGTV